MLEMGKSELRVAIWVGVGLLCSKKLCHCVRALEYSFLYSALPPEWLPRPRTADF